MQVFLSVSRRLTQSATQRCYSLFFWRQIQVTMQGLMSVSLQGLGLQCRFWCISRGLYFCTLPVSSGGSPLPFGVLPPRFLFRQCVVQAELCRRYFVGRRGQGISGSPKIVVHFLTK